MIPDANILIPPSWSDCLALIAALPRHEWAPAAERGAAWADACVTGAPRWWNTAGWITLHHTLRGFATGVDEWRAAFDFLPAPLPPTVVQLANPRTPYAVFFDRVSPGSRGLVSGLPLWLNMDAGDADRGCLVGRTTDGRGCVYLLDVDPSSVEPHIYRAWGILDDAPAPGGVSLPPGRPYLVGGNAPAPEPEGFGHLLTTYARQVAADVSARMDAGMMEKLDRAMRALAEIHGLLAVERAGDDIDPDLDILPAIEAVMSGVSDLVIPSGDAS